jgi:hypothetical protein
MVDEHLVIRQGEAKGVSHPVLEPERSFISMLCGS